MTLEQVDAGLRNDSEDYDWQRAVDVHRWAVVLAAQTADELVAELEVTGGNEVDIAQVLDALARRAEDHAFGGLLSALAGAMAQIAEMEDQIPAEIQEVRERLSRAESIDEMHLILDEVDMQGTDGADDGIRFAREILVDGRDSIYDPNGSPVLEQSPDSEIEDEPDPAPNEPLRRGLRRIRRLAAADTGGAISGGASGVLVGGLGVLPGALSGAVGFSVWDVYKSAARKAGIDGL